MEYTYPVVTTSQELTEVLNRCRKAQAIYATYTQEQVDKSSWPPPPPPTKCAFPWPSRP